MEPSSIVFLLFLEMLYIRNYLSTFSNSHAQAIFEGIASTSEIKRNIPKLYGIQVKVLESRKGVDSQQILYPDIF